ncbi:hypothetical protein DC522_18140 [Microvirga sp. KLBC 81]|uniref:tetratricopeptide repeat protein n=1 Tax=Microvirga sp. KLBC 81 TaxID=1862707 RepID=UPI000D511C7F|nr:tetratricopeptide repeat protein [Microvirga sp. KLBC 81]PVE23014.1 hypothetical protein DC522_18140 [Microvirga sp. KLBC 81]
MSNEQNSMSRPKMPFSGFIAYWRLVLSLLKLRNTPPHTVRFHLIRGRILLSLGLYEQAISDFRSALRLNWRHDEAAFWLNEARRALPRAGETGSFT